MKVQKLGTQGFAHVLALGAISGLLIISGVFALVLKAHHNASTKANLAAAHKSSALKGSLNSPSKSNSNLTTTPSQQSASHQASTTTSSTASSKPTTSQPRSTAAPQASNAPAASTPAPAPATTLSTLTSILTNLKNGSQVNVTASTITVAGPISDAHARPIVFTFNGQTYYAYRQGQPADFTASPSQTANTMAITTGSASVATTQAHLDKAANLVDPNFQVVGYSTGGN